MAKPLNERIASARSTDRISNKDLEALVAEVRDETGRLESSAIQSDRDSVDIALSETDRDEAAAKASRLRRLGAGYSAALAELETKLKRKLESEQGRARQAERAAALQERDDLVARWEEVWPRFNEELLALFTATLASDARLAAAGERDEPSAEAVARGLLRNFSDGTGYYERFTQMKLLPLRGHRRIWPAEDLPFGVGVGLPVSSTRSARDEPDVDVRMLPKLGGFHPGMERIE